MGKFKKDDPMAAKVEAFGNAANNRKSGQVASLKALHDPKATHTHTSVTIRLNEFEEELLKAAAENADRTGIDWMRRTLVNAALDQLEGK
jgi:hypothetical protein